jgi:hypothetical protein
VLKPEEAAVIVLRRDTENSYSVAVLRVAEVTLDSSTVGLDGQQDRIADLRKIGDVKAALKYASLSLEHIANAAAVARQGTAG